jgi:hypothetical protein
VTDDIEPVYGPSVEISWNGPGGPHATCFEVLFTGERTPGVYHVQMSGTYFAHAPDQFKVIGDSPGDALIRCIKGFCRALPDVKIRKIHYSMPEI